MMVSEIELHDHKNALNDLGIYSVSAETTLVKTKDEESILVKIPSEFYERRNSPDLTSDSLKLLFWILSKSGFL